MKHSPKILAVFAASMMFGAAHTASASTIPQYGPCYLELQSLQKKGYAEQAAYTPAAIAQLTQRDGITVHGLDKLKPHHYYTLTYQCEVKNRVVRSSLIAITSDVDKKDKHKKTLRTYIIHWERTSPMTEALRGLPL
ncbi:MAG: hypothetical protein ACNA7Y_06065 [Gammaproteobacteria bacterium]